jgi:hypothetical protein
LCAALPTASTGAVAHRRGHALVLALELRAGLDAQAAAAKRPREPRSGVARHFESAVPGAPPSRRSGLAGLGETAAVKSNHVADRPCRRPRRCGRPRRAPRAPPALPGHRRVRAWRARAGRKGRSPSLPRKSRSRSSLVMLGELEAARDARTACAVSISSVTAFALDRLLEQQPAHVGPGVDRFVAHGAARCRRWRALPPRRACSRADRPSTGFMPGSPAMKSAQ